VRYWALLYIRHPTSAGQSGAVQLHGLVDFRDRMFVDEYLLLTSLQGC